MSADRAHWGARARARRRGLLGRQCVWSLTEDGLPSSGSEGSLSGPWRRREAGSGGESDTSRFGRRVDGRLFQMDTVTVSGDAPAGIGQTGCSKRRARTGWPPSRPARRVRLWPLRWAHAGQSERGGAAQMGGQMVRRRWAEFCNSPAQAVAARKLRVRTIWNCRSSRARRHVIATARCGPQGPTLTTQLRATRPPSGMMLTLRVRFRAIPQHFRSDNCAIWLLVERRRWRGCSTGQQVMFGSVFDPSVEHLSRMHSGHALEACTRGMHQNWQQLVRKRPIADRARSILRKTSTDVGQICSSIAQFWADVCQTWPNFGQDWGDSDRNGPHVARKRSNLGRLRPKLP